MKPEESPPSNQTPMRDIVAYSTGDGALSLMINSFFSFTFIYYTEAIGLDPEWTGAALGAATLWDAITDPLMGHVTDNTRSRFGRRHPYILLGGLLMAICFYGVWAVPSSLQDPIHIFWYLVVMNLLLRTATTIFGVPYIALGFEVCTDYRQRTTLQGVRNGLNMAVNLLGPALLGWSVFLRDTTGPDGEEIRGTTNPQNFENMAITFSIIGCAFILYMCFATRKYVVDTRQADYGASRGLGALLANLWSVLADRMARWVFVFIAVMFLANVLVTAVQMFIYLNYMEFGSFQKTFVHGSTMVAAGLGALACARLVTLMEKRPAIYVSLAFACFGNIMLLVLFSTGILGPQTTWGAFPIALVCFALFHPCYHAGVSAANTIAHSMMADISELNMYKTGVLKDGSYSAMLTFVLKVAIAGGFYLCGKVLGAVGYVQKAEVQAPGVMDNLFIVAFLGGILILAASAICIKFYPVTAAYMDEMRKAHGKDQPPAHLDSPAEIIPSAATEVAYDSELESDDADENGKNQ